MRDLLSDAHAAETRIAPLRLDDGRNEFRGRTFGTGLTSTRRGRKKQAVFPIYQGFVELEQRCRPDERAKLRNPARAHEQRSQPEHYAIERGEIRRTLSGAITDEQLVLQHQGLCGNGADAAW